VVAVCYVMMFEQASNLDSMEKEEADRHWVSDLEDILLVESVEDLRSGGSEPSEREVPTDDEYRRQVAEMARMADMVNEVWGGDG